MNRNCANCGQRFEPEPGFYFGAMFISYIILAFFSLGFTGLLVFYFKLSVDISFALLIGILGLMFIWNLRISRSIWIHLMIKYDSQTAKSK